MSTDLTEKQRRELEHLRIAKELDRREREKSNSTRNWIMAASALVAAAAAVIPLIIPKSPGEPATPAVLPQVIFNNTNGSNNGNVTNSSNAGRDIVNGNNTSNRRGDSTGLSVDLPKPAATTQVKEVSDYRKYIDSNVHRVAGTTNVAIALRGLPGFPPGALESAVQRALRERGFRIVPIFRNQFREDEAEMRLFNGDASFANRLKLQDHCDRLLVGVLRFGGPAQVVDGGMYIREAVLEIHALDPSTGLVIDSLEISEKGGGTTAELSAIDAVSRLKESVLANISGWSWV